MNRTRAILVAGFSFGLMVNSISLAQGADEGAQAQEMKQINEDLEKEIAELKREMAALKGEFGELRAELTKAVAAMKAAAKKPAARVKPAMTMLGKKAPESTVITIDSGTSTIGGKRDKPQVVFCYASWCGFCKKSLPWIDALHQKYKDQGVEVLALNLDSRGEGGRNRTEEQTLKHFLGMKLSMPMTMTTATNDTKKIGAAYKATSFPTLFVLGTTGEVESVHVGAKKGLDKIVGAELDLLLAGKTRADFAK